MIILRVIYIDILLAINLAVDYLLLFGTARLAGAKYERLKGLLGASVGAIYSIIIIFEVSKTVFAATKLAVSAIMIFAAFGKRNLKEFTRLLTVFYICGFLFSGFMMLLNYFTKTDSFYIKGGIVYYEISAMEIVFSGTAAFFVTEILRRLFRHGEPEGACMAKIYFNKKCTVLKGFTDTGNSLSEPFSGSPVAMADIKSMEKILPEEMAEEIKNGDVSTRFGLKPVFCKTVSGSVLIKTFRPDKVLIENEKGVFTAEDILIGASENVPENTLIFGKNVLLKKEGKIFSEV